MTEADKREKLCRYCRSMGKCDACIFHHGWCETENIQSIDTEMLNAAIDLIDAIENLDSKAETNARMMTYGEAADILSGWTGIGISSMNTDRCEVAFGVSISKVKEALSMAIEAIRLREGV